MKHPLNYLSNLLLFKFWRWKMLRDLRKSGAWDRF